MFYFFRSVVAAVAAALAAAVDTRYICRSMETPGQISWEYDVDPQMLLHQNQNVAGLKRNSNLIHKTPLMLGRGTSSFVTREKAEDIFATIGTRLLRRLLLLFLLLLRLLRLLRLCCDFAVVPYWL